MLLLDLKGWWKLEEALVQDSNHFRGYSDLHPPSDGGPCLQKKTGNATERQRGMEMDSDLEESPRELSSMHGSKYPPGWDATGVGVGDIDGLALGILHKEKIIRTLVSCLKVPQCEL